jgi:hypothetical protein
MLWSDLIINNMYPKGHNYLKFPWSLPLAGIDPRIYRNDNDALLCSEEMHPRL